MAHRLVAPKYRDLTHEFVASRSRSFMNFRISGIDVEALG